MELVFVFDGGLNLSNQQIAQELDLSKDDVHQMTTQLRTGVDLKPGPVLEGVVECDEVYIVASHKGHPEAVKKGRTRHRRLLREARGQGTLEKEKPPVFGMIQRNGEVDIQTLPDVKQRMSTIKPIIGEKIARSYNRHDR